MSDNTAVTSTGQPSKLPTIAEIYANDHMPVLQKDAVFQTLVNQEPKKEWLKLHPTAKKEIKDANGQKRYVPCEYMPIERIEWLLTNVCLKWKVEVKQVQLIGNSVTVTIRLHYYDHPAKEWLWQDGVGAAPLQTDKGAGATDFNALKSSAVQIGVPAAKSYAVKDAAECIGKMFGRDLNRDGVLSYDNIADRYAKALSDE